ncbi:hypothetical protein ACWIUD_06985 [Helicobacter sp. 23-1044]
MTKWGQILRLKFLRYYFLIILPTPLIPLRKGGGISFVIARFGNAESWQSIWYF